jgi:phosphoglycolate phosphatase
MPLKAILFDKDGTLIDFDRTWGEAGYKVMQSLAKGDEAAFARLVTVSDYDLERRTYRPSSHLVAGASGDFGVLWARALERTDVTTVIDEIDRLFMAEAHLSLSPIGDPLAILSELAMRGFALGIATNDAEAAAFQQAELLGLTPHLAFIVGRDSGHGRKPDPGMVAAFARKTGHAVNEIALVGDSTHDLHAARAAGAVAIAVLSGPASEAELAPHADHVIASIIDLPALLEQI